MTISLRVIDRSIIELDAHVFALELNFVDREVCAVVSYDVVGDAVMVYNLGYKAYHRSGFGRLNRLSFYLFGELIHHDQ